jgi:hypothetical protein
MAKKAAKSGSKAKVASATTVRTGMKGADATKVTNVEDENKAAKSTAKEAPAREGHAPGVPRKTMLEKFGPDNPDLATVSAQRAAVGR